MNIRDEKEFAKRTYGVGDGALRALAIDPPLIAALFALLLVIPATRALGTRFLQEDNVVEWATAFSAFAGAIYGFRFLGRARRHRMPAFPLIFYALVTAGLFVLGGEEISWGQRIVGFHTPASLSEFNRQGEFNFHNLPELEGLEKFVIVSLALAGILRQRNSRHPDRRGIRVPGILAPCLWTILVSGTLYLYDYYFVEGQTLFSLVIDRLVEVTEMWFAAACATFLWLDGRMHGIAWKEEGEGATRGG
jgi:hypothetical protein